MQYKISIYSHLNPFENAQIVLDPTISGTMCSGGVSGGGCSTKTFEFSLYAPEFSDMSDHLGYAVQLYANIGVNPEQCYGDWYITEYTAMENGRHKFKCTDAIGYLGEDYATETALDGDGMITATNAAEVCLTHLNLSADNYFTTWVKGAAEVPKKDLRGKKYRDILAYLAARNCVNIYEHHGKLSAWAPWLTKDTIESSVYAPIKNTCATSFTKTSVAGDKTYVSGTGTPEKTFYHKYKNATQDSADLLLTNLDDYTYKAFKCDKCVVAGSTIANSILQWADVGDTFSPVSAPIMAFKLILNPNGIYGTFSADIVKKNVDKPVDESEGGSGAAIDNVNNFAGATSGSSGVVALTWQMPETPITNVIIKRKRSTAFTSIFDGDVIDVNNGTALEYHDTVPDLFHSWYYRTLTNKDDIYNGSDNAIMIAAITRGKYLYNLGDECQSVTGYWYGGFPTLPNQVNGIYANWDNNYILLPCAPDNSNKFTVSYYKARNIIDFTGFSKICAEIEVIKSKTYNPSADSNYTDMIARDMPYYDYADISSTATEYPYVAATYRGTNTQGKFGYWVYFSKLPFYYGIFNNISKLMQNGTCVRVLYYGDGSGVYTAGSSITFSDGLDILTPSSTPDTSEGDYMGGAYQNGGNNIYATEGNLKVVSDARFWMATKKLNNYDWSEKVSSVKLTQEQATLGTHIVEMTLIDEDDTVNPPIFRDYVTFGVFEAEIKVHSIWLQE